MRKIFPIIALLVAMCFILTGCGSFVDWGDEETKQIDYIDSHTDSNGVVYMDIHYVGQDTPDSIPLPSGTDGTSISFDAKYDPDNRKTIVTVSFSNGTADRVFEISDGQSISNVTIVNELGQDYLYFWCGTKPVGSIPLDYIKGKDGATWLTGTTAPSESIGKDGDFYLNTAKFDVYLKKNDLWTTVGNLTGVGIDKIETYESADGNGLKITYTDPTWKPTTVICPGIVDINLNLSNDKKQFVFEVVLSNGIVDENGVTQTFSKEFAIARFPQWDSGTNWPTSTDGIVGDFYFYEPTQTILQKKDTGWKTIISFSELLNQENETVQITFDANGGQMNITGYTKPTSKYTMNGVSKGSFVHADSIPIPTRDGYTFMGWYTTPNPNPLVNGMFTDMVPVSQDITLYAHWVANSATE